LVNVQGWSDVPAGSSLFDSIVVFENFDLDTLMRGQGGPWSNRRFRLLDKTNFGITLVAYAEPELHFKIDFDTSRFDDATIKRMLGHLRTLLESMACQPPARLGELPLLTPAERQQLLVEWNDTSTAYPCDKCLHRMFEEQVDRTPDAVAVTFEGQQLTYRELNVRANELARYLRTLGVSSETIVAICIERCVEMVVGILGIVKAGGAYVPLDPAYPKERIAFMLEDSQAAVLLTQREFAASLPAQTARIVCLDSDWSEIAAAPECDLASAASPANLAYIIYTSGSTGQPKGVGIEHRHVVRLFLATETCFHFDSGDVWTMFHTYAFDFSVWELWGALLYGGRLVIVPYEVSRTPDAFYRLLIKEKVTVLNQTPSAFRQLVWAEGSAGQYREPLDLRYVIFGGESLDVHALRPWWDRHGDATPQLVNMYGITETTVHVTYRLLHRSDLDRPTSPIGRPINDLQIYLLDARRQPVPIGVPGEIYVGGAGVARGYWNRPQLTAERFVPNPFCDDLGSRLYKSGDLARFLPDGGLEFLGRADDQVKVRGFRIELGEIETVLGQHPKVRETVIVTSEGLRGDKRLVAYIVPQSVGALPTTAEMRQQLHKKLPDYMIPSAFVFLDALPLTSNGKVDRKSLPAPDESRPDIEIDYVAPSNRVEELLAAIWCDLLGIEQVGIHDNFFALGGHSLLAATIQSRIESEALVNLPLRKLFETPTIAELSSEIEAIRRDGQTAPSERLQRVDRNELDRLPLSFAQERLWFLDQLEGGSATYNIPWFVRLRGRLNVSALERSLQEVARRHEVLRTTCVTVDGIPRAMVREPAAFRLTVTDLKSAAEADRETQAVRLASEEAGRAFDLARDLMLRAHLLQLGDQDQVLILTMHHVASDGWSMGVFAHELSVLYEAFAQDESSPLPELPIQYLDFAVWQRKWLQGDVLDQQLAYWKEQLAGAPAILELPTDFPRPRELSYRGARQEFVLDARLTQALHMLSRREEVTPFMLLLAAWQVLLSRYSGQEDVLVGSPIAGRNRMELEGLIGCFLNTLVLRTDLSANPTFRDLLQRVREVTLGAYAHQDLPFEKLVEELRPERSLAHSPLFQVLFVLQKAAADLLELPGIVASDLSIDNPTAKFDLTLSLGERNGQLHGTLEYSTDLFQAKTIERLIGHFQVLLEAIVADPGQRIRDLPLLTESERQQLLVDWNDTASEFPRDKCVHELFEAQVERTPDAVAIAFEDQQLSYRELNEQANRLAHYLRAKGVGPNVLVGLGLPRSIDMMVAILGILKAGGAYVPLDAAYPRKRLEFMLQDTAIRILITDTAQIEQLPLESLDVICLYSAREMLATQSRVNPPRLARPDSLAYLLYTSGSTGQPKGVEVAHHGVVNVLTSVTALLKLQPGERLLGFASPTFDISVAEFFLPTLVGGMTILTGRDVVYDSLQIVDVIRKQKPSVVQATPVTWQMLADCDGWGGPDVTIISTGEALPKSLANQLLRKCGTLWNLYGPTETTIWSTACRVSNPSDSIGRPIHNTQVYVLDNWHQPVPIGTWGELYIGGDGLARGYRNRSDLTSERFVANPFSTNLGSRLYRTGDSVRWSADGNLEYQGRLDNQVKLRGFRIELGEIESALRGHEDVAQCAVIVREDRPDDKRIVAYWVSRSGDETLGLRQYLANRLPHYMIPSSFVCLKSLPVSPSGKLDRKALPAPERRRFEAEYVAPRDAVEQSLADICSEVLGIERISIHDNFFALGGHSLTATQVVARACAVLRVELPLRDLFNMPTIAELAARVAVLRSGSVNLSYQPLTRIDRSTSVQVPLSFAQERMWFLDQLQGESVAYNVSYALRLEGPLDAEPLRRALEAIVHRHDPLRTAFTISSGELVQIIQPPPTFELPLSDLRKLPADAQEAEVARWAREVAERPFDLANDVMLRASLLRLADNEHILLLVMHHVAWDGWSEHVLWRELAALYDAYCRKESISLPELPFLYVDYAVWQRNLLQGDKLERLMEYWRKQLNEITALELPTDRPRPALLSYRGAYHNFDLRPELVRSLQELSRSEDVTLHMTLLAAFQTLLSLNSGQDDISVGVPIAGRNHADLETQIGLFVNTLVIRTNLSGNPTFCELLGRVRDSSLGAYDHQDLPFEKLVEELQPQRDMTRSPLAQVMFQLLSFPGDDPKLPGLEVSRLPSPIHRVRFDLEMHLWSRTGGIRGLIVYSTELFDADTIERMRQDLVLLLEGIVADPSRPITAIPLATNRSPEHVQIASSLDSTSLPAPQLRTQTVHGYEPPQSDMERIMATVWQTALGVGRVGVYDDFFDLGGHSILAARVCVELEKRLNRRVPLALLFGAPNIRGLAQLIAKEQSIRGAITIVPLQASGQGAPLFLMPSISGLPLPRKNLLDGVDLNRPVYAVGLTDPNPPWNKHASMQEIARYFAEALRDAKLTAPPHILGYSFGGMLAYEVARQLQEANFPVGLLLIVDTGPEQLLDNSRRRSFGNLFRFVANVPPWMMNFAVNTTASQKVYLIHRKLRSWGRRFAAMAAEQRTTIHLDDAIDTRRVPDDFRKCMETNHQAFQTYSPGPYSGRLVLFRAKLRPLLHGFTPDLNWRQIVTGGVEVIQIPGNHGSILLPPNAHVLAAQVQAILNGS
jgi:amino acid adenylation domain-containing protein